MPWSETAVPTVADGLTDLAAFAGRTASRLQEMGPVQRRELVGLLQLDVR